MKTKRRRKSIKGTDAANTLNKISENAFGTYLKEINRIPLLKKEEEEKIAKLAKQGDKTARDKLINSNLRFVVMIAKKFQGKGLSLEDLVSEGNIGLINAISHYDVERGYRFITYAVWWIKQALVNAIHDKSRLIRLPSNKSKALIRAEKEKQLLQRETIELSNREIEEIAEALNLCTEKAASLIMMSQKHISLDDLSSASLDFTPMKDSLEDIKSLLPDEIAINSIMKEDLNKALTKLSERDAEIIRCRYGIGSNKNMTLKEIGERYNLTRERIRQIENRILGQLRHSSNWKNLEGYTA